MRLSVGYPLRSDELSILDTHAVDGAVDRLKPIVKLSDVITMTKIASMIAIAPELQNYLVDIAEATRRHPSVSLGMSPRATLSLQRVAKARAASQTRTFVIDDDIKASATSVIAHRLLLTPDATIKGHTADQVVTDILRAIPVPADRV